MSRASKSGIGYGIAKKMEERYDQEEAAGVPGRINAWVNATLAGGPQCSSSDWKQLAAHWKDGVVLCMFLNKLREGDGKSAVKFSKKAGTTFVAMGNIETFNKSAVEYGLGQGEAFDSVDLYEGQKAYMVNVINCLNQLGKVANSKGFKPAYEMPDAPKLEW